METNNTNYINNINKLYYEINELNYEMGHV